MEKENEGKKSEISVRWVSENWTNIGKGKEKNKKTEEVKEKRKIGKDKEYKGKDGGKINKIV